MDLKLTQDELLSIAAGLALENIILNKRLTALQSKYESEERNS